MSEEKAARIHEGRTASVFLNWANPIFEGVEKDLIESLKNNFRQGTYTELVLACHVAQLCAIEDIKNKVRGICRQGEAAAQETEGL